MDAGEEVGGEPVVAGGEAAAVFEVAEHAFDGIAALVGDLAEAALLQAGALGWNVRNDALALDQLTNAVGVVGAVGMHDAALGQVGQQVLGRPAVRRLARRQVEGERPSVAVGDGVDLGVAAAPGSPRRSCVTLLRRAGHCDCRSNMGRATAALSTVDDSVRN